MAGSGRVVLIAGPTASGKSALALALAKARGGDIVNTDSMQVYRDLRVLTARPSPEEEQGAPHRLYGHVDGGLNYSVGRYLDDAARLVGDAGSREKDLIFVGGTGLYFKALLEGLSDVPPVPQAIRDAVRAESEGRTAPELHAELARRDPRSAGALAPNDRLRILRALEVLAATGQPLASFRGRKQPGPLAASDPVRFFLAPDRDWLRARIEARFAAMIGQGALDEVRALGERRLDPALPVMRAHGVPALLAHLRGEITRDEAIAQGQADTRRYAKRQFTWFRHQMPGWTWVAPDAAEAALRETFSA
ncbi:MAG TPA: tRNA (adenosine(37)-N6)-dimethylallyltransferase MiaA [Beijerinckiaceae bacterium]|nr:tRNA (adenosine(37)-N6)-dimethylallyltransferase MiaA [Beijerinckiaceae bacterium]